MTQFEYMVVPAPLRSRKITGAGTGAARFAATLAEDLNTQAAEGWEFLRSETLPHEERSGLTGTKQIFRTMLVYRRPAGIAESDATREALRLLEDQSVPEV